MKTGLEHAFDQADASGQRYEARNRAAKKQSESLRGHPSKMKQGIEIAGSLETEGVMLGRTTSFSN
jgi:hypothetical protein